MLMQELIESSAMYESLDVYFLITFLTFDGPWYFLISILEPEVNHHLRISSTCPHLTLEEGHVWQKHVAVLKTFNH
jgi:hypothetical protein